MAIDIDRELAEELTRFHEVRQRDARNLMMLKRAANDFWQGNPTLTRESYRISATRTDFMTWMWLSFGEYAKKTYGIRISYVGDWLNPVYEVIDEELHTLFLLKYG